MPAQSFIRRLADREWRVAVHEAPANASPQIAANASPQIPSIAVGSVRFVDDRP